jgi:hypothetical protein
MDTTVPMNGIMMSTIIHIEDPHVLIVRTLDGHEFTATPTNAVPWELCKKAHANGAHAMIIQDPRDEHHAIILGLMRPSAPAAITTNQHVIIKGDDQVEISCGKASITLASSGKVVIRGTNILSRSSGANRVKGGSVQIN